MERETDTQPKEISLVEQYQLAFDRVNWTLHATRKIIYDKPWMKIHHEDWKKSSGEVAEKFVRVETEDYAEILAIDPEKGVIVLVCEFTRGKDAPHIKLPAGKVKAGQEPIDAARAELREETGREADVNKMVSKHGIPMWYSAEAHFAFAKVDANSYTEQILDKHEEIAVIQAPISEVVEMVLTDHPLMDDLELSFAVLYAAQTGIIEDKYLPSPENHPKQ